MSKQHKVHIREVKDYYIVVEGANTLEEAEELAYNDPKFINNISDDLDSEVVTVEEITDLSD